MANSGKAVKKAKKGEGAARPTLRAAAATRNVTATRAPAASAIGESPIDLGSQVDEELQAVQLIIAHVNPADLNPQAAALLANAQATRDHLQLLQAHMQAANTIVKVNPQDPDFLTLSAIGARLDRAIRNGALVSEVLSDMQVLLGTVNQGFQIAHRLAN